MKNLIKLFVNWLHTFFKREKVQEAITPVVKEWSPVETYRRPPVMLKKHNNRKRTRGRNFQVITYRVNSHIRDDKTWDRGRLTSRVIYHNN